MSNNTVEEKISCLNKLINEGDGLVITRSYSQQNYSFDPYNNDNSVTSVSYMGVDSVNFPNWRMKSLAFLKGNLGSHSTYVREFEQSCKAAPNEDHVNCGTGILRAVLSGYQDGTLLMENPPIYKKDELNFQIVNNIKNSNNLVSNNNFDMLVMQIEKSNKNNKEELVNKIKDIEQELDRGDTNWETLKSWINFALGLGKDLGINLIASIIAKQTNLG